MPDAAAVPASGCASVYGVTFAEFVALDAGGPVTHQALATAASTSPCCSRTDPALGDYVELTDDRHLQPAENVTPLVTRAR